MVALISVVAFAIVLTAPAISANTLYPSGCHRYAWGAGKDKWDNNCWLGENGNRYIDYAAYVQGLQIILKGFGYYTLAVDGIFGNGTYTGVRLYQNHENISSDGIVGNVTWHQLRGELYFSFYQCSATCWYTYSSPGTIGLNRWSMGDYIDVNGHYGPWAYAWSGLEVLFGNNPPV